MKTAVTTTEPTVVTLTVQERVVVVNVRSVKTAFKVIPYDSGITQRFG